MTSKNQKINCTVQSCIYNIREDGKCSLESIKVVPTKNVKSKKPDESQCSSYKAEL